MRTEHHEECKTNLMMLARKNTMKNLLKDFWDKCVDLGHPRACAVCGDRLAIAERLLCGNCNFKLTRTYYWKNAKDNEMAKAFWVQIPVERAAAWFFHLPHTNESQLIYRLKYGEQPEIGEKMGRVAAGEFQESGFFEGVDAIIPVPLTKKRKRERGYNQSMEIARGVRKATGIPIWGKVLKRKTFAGSQTRKDRRARHDNVEGAFVLRKGVSLEGKHLLIVDDVVTTGATVIACAKELMKGGNIKVSVLSLGFAKG